MGSAGFTQSVGEWVKIGENQELIDCVLEMSKTKSRDVSLYRNGKKIKNYMSLSVTTYGVDTVYILEVDGKENKKHFISEYSVNEKQCSTWIDNK